MNHLHTSADDPDAKHRQSKMYVFVHGAYHGGWCWKRVTSCLRAMGHTVYRPSLTGMGERSHLLPFMPSLETWIEDVARVIGYEELEQVILVGHGFGGSIISALADRIPHQLQHLVYLDAHLVQGGQSLEDVLPLELMARCRRRALDAGDGWRIPAEPPEYFGITEQPMVDWMREKLGPHPLRACTDRLHLASPLGNRLPATYIACTEPLFSETSYARDLAKRLPGWTYVDIATAHDAMLLKPGELAEVLASIE